MDIIEQDIITILQGLKNSGPAYISDLLLGFQRYPSSGTEEDNRIRMLEGELINRDLVIVVEQGGTNKTQDGYYLFRISSRGISYLQSRPAPVESPKRRPKYALSTRFNDDGLANEGLQNVGLLGFLESEQKEATFPLQHFHLTFPKGDDHFYTLDDERERFENRNPIKLDVLGFARKNGDTEHVLLHRFFDNDSHNHIYVTNPDFEIIKGLNFRHEYNDNPIFIKRNDYSGGLPLFLYSTVNVNFFYPVGDYSSDSDGDTEEGELIPDNFKIDFENIMVENNLDLTRFSFKEVGSVGGERALTVGVNESFMNFYVNLQKNQTYFTVRRNPEPSDEAYIVHDIELWSEVVRRFKSWILDVKEELGLTSNSIPLDTVENQQRNEESISSILNRRIHSHYEFAMGDSQDIDPALNIEKLAGQVAKIINNLKAEPGNMTGIFAQWGRGKTRLMNEIWKCLQTSEAKFDYQLVRYQAWRYQHTPASWAYLYEQFSTSYLGNKKTVFSFIKYHRKLFRLNLIRDGWMNFIISIFLFSALVWGIWEAVKKVWEVDIDYAGIIPIAVLSLGTIISVVVKNLKTEYLTRAISLIKKYMEKVSFNEALGMQAEIQKELIHLINAWVKIKKAKPVKTVDLRGNVRPWWARFFHIMLTKPSKKKKSVPSAVKKLSKRGYFDLFIS